MDIRTAVLYLSVTTLFCVHSQACTTEPYCVRGPYGIHRGERFNDFELFKQSSSCHNITRVEVWHTDTSIEGFKMTYGGVVSPLRGSSGGTHANHELESEEWIVKVHLYTDDVHNIVGLQYNTNKGREFGPYGGQGNEQTAVGTHDNNSGLSWLSGRGDDSNFYQVWYYFNCNI